MLEVTGAVVVGIGGVTAIVRLMRAAAAPGGVQFTPVRLDFARYLSLALEFQLAADIVATAVAPSWARIGELGAIAFIRTALNYFLGREMAEERSDRGGGCGLAPGSPDGGARAPARS